MTGVTVVCWLMGTATGDAERVAALHDGRLRMLWEKLVDTPVRGVVHEAAGPLPAAVLERGRAVALTAHETWRIPLELLEADPGRPRRLAGRGGSGGGPAAWHAAASHSPRAARVDRTTGVDPEEMAFTVEAGDGVVRPHGELDLATAGLVRDALREQAGAHGRVTLDLGGLRFLDTSGLRLVLETVEASERDGLRLHRPARGAGGAAPVRPRRGDRDGPVRQRGGPGRAVTTARRGADAAARLEVLMAVAAVADATHALDDVMPRLLDELVPAVADLCMIEDADGRPLAVRYAGPAAAEVEAPCSPVRRRPMTRRSPAGACSPRGGRCSRAWTTRCTAGRRTTRRSSRSLRRLDFRSMIVAPLRAHGVAARATSCWPRGRRATPYGDADVRFAEAVALQLARAIDATRLAAMTRELQALVDNMDDAVNVRDLDGRIVLANAASAAMLHAQAPDELPDTPLPELWDRFSLFDADGAALHDEHLPWYRLLHGEPHVEPLLMRRVTRETGEQQWLVNKATAIRDPAGRAVLVMSVTEDVTAAAPGRDRPAPAGGGRAASSPARSTRRASLQEVAELVVPTVADWCGIDLPGASGAMEAAAVAHLDPERAAKVRELRRRYPVTVDGPSGPAMVLRTGRAAPGRRGHGRDAAGRGRRRDPPRAAARDRPELAARRARCGPARTSSACCCSAPRSRTGASTTTTSSSPTRWRAGSARRCATRRLYRERDAIAHVLSAGLAPDQAPQVAGCEVALRYRPAGDGVEAGGDFYEVVDTPAGVIVLIGDVAGKGAAAAALSAVCRVTLRTAARLTGDPQAALDELNHVLRRRDTLSLCTVGALALPPELPGTARLLLAGHPPPLLVRDGRVRAVGRSGPLLGAVEAADWPPEPRRAPARRHARPLHGRRARRRPGRRRALRRGAAGGARGARRRRTRRRSSPRSTTRSRGCGCATTSPCSRSAAPASSRCSRAARSTARWSGCSCCRSPAARRRRRPPARRSAPRSRAASRGTLESDALLIASELVTNAVRHGGARTPARRSSSTSRWSARASASRSSIPATASSPARTARATTAATACICSIGSPRAGASRARRPPPSGRSSARRRQPPDGAPGGRARGDRRRSGPWRPRSAVADLVGVRPEGHAAAHQAAAP